MSPELTPGAFCPHAGLVGGSSDQFLANQHALANSRLKIAAVIMCSAATAFLFRNVLIGTYDTPMLQKLGFAHGALVVGLALITGALHFVRVGCRIRLLATERGGVLDVAKLLDFGLVKSVVPQGSSPEITIEGAVIGSPQYAPPERVTGNGETDARGDIYSLGATAYFVLTGEGMFGGDSPLKILFAHANESPRPLSSYDNSIPPDLEAVVMRCLSKSPDDRYQTARDLEAALAACANAGGWSQENARAAWDNVSSNPLGMEQDIPASELETQLIH